MKAFGAAILLIVMIFTAAFFVGFGLEGGAIMASQYFGGYG